MSGCILSVDQSTQGTKGLLFDEAGALIARADLPHRQIVNEQGWVEHDPAEILENVVQVCADVLRKAGIAPGQVRAIGLSNQRETTVAWDRSSGKPLCNAIVWQCARASELCAAHEAEAERVFRATGLRLSPYFPAPKMEWLLKHVPTVRAAAEAGTLCFGTVDSWMLFSLCGVHKTDYSNASRTMLFNLSTLQWDGALCELFGIPENALPEVCMSDSVFGQTDLKGLLPAPVPVCGVLGDSHGALFGQNCRTPGQLKATYGTGSSVMLNIGERPIWSESGLVTSLAWGIGGKVNYVFEGNLNYTGAVISWLKDRVGLIQSPGETAELCRRADPQDKAYFVPAFTGLGSPYWDSAATGLLTGVTRTTGRAEIVKACVECIAYQITDLLELMRQEYGGKLETLRVDGGPTANAYLMQFQSDMAQSELEIPQLQELSGMGAAYLAGISAGFYDAETVFQGIRYTAYAPAMAPKAREQRYRGWKQAVAQVLAHA